MSATLALDRRRQEWFAYRAESKEGPMNYLDLVRMLQDRSLQEYHFVWKPGWPVWKRVSDCEEFSPDTIQSLCGVEDLQIQQVFYRRRYARATYQADILVHNNKTVWPAMSVQISQGGAGLNIKDSNLQIGQTVFLHFKTGEKVPPFNAIASIVSKKDDFYGVKFTRISQSVTSAIKSFTELQA